MKVCTWRILNANMRKEQLKMAPIILCFSNRKSGTFDLFSKNLSDFYAVLSIDKKNVSLAGDGKTIILLDHPSVKDISAPNTILVFDETYFPDCEFTLSPSSICIASSDNDALLQILSRSQSKVITCGMCPKDTVTCSSTSDHALLVSLQRQIVNLFGQTVEPQELFLTRTAGHSTNNPPPNDLLAYAALLFLLGAVTEQQKSEITIH